MTTVATRRGEGTAHRGPRRSVRPELAVSALAGAGAVAILIWCAHSIGASHLATTAARLSAWARVTGMLAAYASLVEVLLVGRLPVLERNVPAHLLRLAHGWNGGAVVALSVAHASFAIGSQSAASGHRFAGAAGDLVLHFRFVVLAAIGLGLLLVASLTSARPVRRRLGYVRWRVLHSVTYLAVALAFLHELLGVELRGTVAKVVWSAMFAAVAAAVLWYRVAQPLVVSRRHQLRVASVVEEAPDVLSVRVTGRDLDGLRAYPGQYLRWRFLTGRDWVRSRPYSLSAVPTAGSLRFTVKAFGDHAAMLRALPVGTRVAVEGPYGALTERWRTRRRVLLVAGGLGVAPLRALLEGLWARPGDLTLVYRATRAADVVFREELDEIAERRGATVRYLLGPPGGDGRPEPLAPVALAALVPRLADCDAYVCGPPGMVETAVASLLVAGVPAHQVHAETFVF